ncbi:MAG: glycosyltransferase family 2 protein [Cyanobacteriota bacterium]|nr:glycosyltransferase family 2 protein [Cyanobacteriota bacterium]
MVPKLRLKTNPGLTDRQNRKAAIGFEPPPNYWQPLLTPGQQWRLQSLIALWLLASIGFWVWWFQPNHQVSWLGGGLTSLVLGVELFLPAYFFGFVQRMQRVNPQLALPSAWRVAMVVTKAPSEPWPVVQATLRAMLAQGFPHHTWLADEAPTPETLAWCQEQGVRVSCRQGQPDYHRSSWPRRTRCKEGNLAYFYDTVGYHAYDFVCQLDADHQPEPGYLEEMLRPFLHPGVGYVAAPSLCDVNAAKSWAARARLWAEASLHGPLQAGYNHHWAPLCIGSHYAVRTEALQEIGGIGPELAEDHSTSLMMNAYGWQGVFQPSAIAHGEGPASFVDAMTQEFQWSRSLTKVLLETTPRYWPGLKPHLRAQFLFAQLWYALFSTSVLIGFSLPLLALALDHPWLAMNYPMFLAASLGLALVTCLPVWWLRACGCLRPINTPLISWEVVLFTIARAPWVLLGVSQGILSTLWPRPITFKVTPKGDHQDRSLPLASLLPYGLLAGLEIAAVLGLHRVSHTQGYYWLALVNAGFYVVATALILGLHRRENPEPGHSYRSHHILSLSLIGSFLLASGVRLPASLKTFSTQSLGPVTLAAAKPQPPAGAAAIPELNQPQPAFGVYDPDHSFDGLAGVEIDHHFVTWRLDNATEMATAIAAAQARHRLPLITLEPWPWNWQGMTDATLLQDITAGRYDPTLERLFQVIGAASPQPILLRFAHEMEMVGRYPWAVPEAPAYIAAYRHVVDLAREAGVKNVRWVWSPAGNAEARAYWPGAEYVDYVGLSIYATPEWTWGLAPPGELLSFAELISHKYWVAEAYHRPVLLTEVGVNAVPAAKQQWLEEAVRVFNDFPTIRAWVYFNQVQPDIVPLEIGKPAWQLTPDQARRLSEDWGQVTSHPPSQAP